MAKGIYTAPRRIVRHGRLVIAEGQQMPMERAIELGLVKPQPKPQPQPTAEKPKAAPRKRRTTAAKAEGQGETTPRKRTTRRRTTKKAEAE